ncbi:MAG TPA: glycosyltransferase family 2 protein [Flavobacterium sp.]|jgi:GT2 family glycosyltransferase
MQLSVIILNYNVRFFLEQCISSVIRALDGIDGEIIVVDNNSADESCAMVLDRFPSVKLIASSENTGFPKGNNIGVAEAGGKYICILNPDTVVGENTFREILAFAENKKNLGIVGIKLIDGAGNFLPESKRGIPTPFVAFSRIAGLHKLSPKFFGKYYAQHLSPDETGKVEILVGAFMLMERSLYLRVGGFDENCFMYSDDIDLSYSVLKSGRDNLYFGGTTAIHYKGESTLRDGTYMKRFREAMDFFYKKHFRKSYFLDFFLKAGTYFFVLAKKNRPAAKERNISRYILVSSDSRLKEQLENALGTQLERVADCSSIPSLVKFQNREIIFDAFDVTFEGIIATMQQLKSNETTYKIVHPNHTFAIGSNSSTDRGKLIKLADHR